MTQKALVLVLTQDSSGAKQAAPTPATNGANGGEMHAACEDTSHSTVNSVIKLVQSDVFIKLCFSFSRSQCWIHSV